MASSKKGCPDCGQRNLVRVARIGFLKERIYPKFGFYPWECPQCRRKLLLRRRGIREEFLSNTHPGESGPISQGHLHHT